MSFPCISCGVILATSNEQREHYKSEWHRYNLKRKVVNLPPVTIDEFNLKNELFAKTDRQNAESGGEEKVRKQLPHCPACSKKFSSAKAYENHVASRKHKQRVESAAAAAKDPQPRSESPEWLSVDGDSDAGSDEDDEGQQSPLGQEECLFCPNVAASLESNCAHMLREHGFVLPDADLLTDLEGLITLLDYKVGVGYECLWCHGAKRFDSLRAVRCHMLDKGHCRYNLAGEHAFDLADFYDYSSLGISDAAGGNAGSGSDSDDEDEAPTDLEAFELVLPSGAVVGHRSLMRYYRQSPAPSRAVVLAAPGAGGGSSHQRLLAQYRSIGWHGPTRTQAELASLRDRAFVQRHRQRVNVQLGLGANRLQKHFRHQNPK